MPWSVGTPAGGAPVELDVPPARDERERRVAAEEREAAPPLGVLDRLEQERRVVVGGADQLHERRDRRLEVGEHLAPDRHDRVVARQRDELVAREPRRGHDQAQTGPGVAPPPKARKKQLCSPVWHAPRPSCSTTNSNTSMSQS